MDYNDLLDDDVKAFIATSASFYPEHRDELGIDAQRGFYNALCAHFHQPRPDGMTVTDKQVQGIPTRQYQPSNLAAARPHIIYIHGGGFVVGNLDTHDDVCAGIAADTGAMVTAIDYRLAPEHVAPGALDDCRTVLAEILTSPADDAKGPVIIAGDSAGGYLSAMLALEFGTKLAGQVLIYPMLGGRMDQGSYIDHANAPMLNTDQVQYYWEVYENVAIPRDKELLPMSAPDHAHLPPAIIIGAGCDPLLSDAPQYAEKLTAAGVNVTLYIADGLPHGFMRARHSTVRANTAYQQLIAGMCSFFAT